MHGNFLIMARTRVIRGGVRGRNGKRGKIIRKLWQ